MAETSKSPTALDKAAETAFSFFGGVSIEDCQA